MSRRARIVAVSVSLCLGLVAACEARAQTPPLVLRGRVVAESNDRPLRHALITLNGSDRRGVLTDDEGRFELPVPDSTSTLTVAKAGYASMAVAAPRSFAPEQELLVRLRRGGVIAGRVVDSNGETALGVRVAARLDDEAGVEIRSFETEADDLGEYRLAGLPAGSYTVSPLLDGMRIATAVELGRIQGLMQQGRALQDLLQESASPPRTAEVRTGDETAGIDFEVPARTTLRALVPVKHLVPDASTLPAGQQAMFTTPPQPQLGGNRIVLFASPGRAPRTLDIVASGGGAISGSVVDSAGEAFQGVTVRTFRVRHENGRTVARAFGWPRITDDRGRYRAFGLAPGSYLIVASIDAAEYARGGAPSVGMVPTYYPGTSRLDGVQPLLVEAESDVSGIDLTLAAAPAARVSGRVVNSAGEPVQGPVLLGISQRSGAIAPDPRSVRAGADGAFEFVDVAPGDYVLQAVVESRFGSPPEFGSEPVTVAERTPATTIRTSPGVTLEGRFIVEGVPDPSMRAFSLHASPTDLDRSPPNGRGPEGLAVHDDGRFYLTGLHGPVRFSAPSTMRGWYLKAVTINGVDATDVPFDFGHTEATVSDAEVVLSSAGAAIAGTIEDRPGSRAAAALVIAFSTTRANWFDGSRHIKAIASGANGSFDVTGLPPGEYFVVAVDAAAPLDWRGPDALESLVSRASRVIAREGGVATVALRALR